MSSSPLPPNPAIAELLDVLGDDDTRDLIRTYLQEFSGLIRTMATDDRTAQHRAVHSLKSSSLHMGLTALSRRLQTLEASLLLPEGSLHATDLAAITEEFERGVAPLRAYLRTK